jgi:hypothetical protein
MVGLTVFAFPYGNENYACEVSNVSEFTSCLPMVGGSLRVLQLLPPLKLVAII